MARSFEYEWSRGFNIYVQTPQMRRMEDSRDMLLRPEPAKDVRLYALFLFSAGATKPCSPSPWLL